MGQNRAGPRTSCFCGERRSAVSDGMDKSRLLQLLPGSRVFTASGAEEGAPEKHPGAVEAAGDVGSTTAPGEAAQGTRVEAPRQLKQQGKALGTL